MLPPARGSAAFLGKSRLPREKRKELALHEFSGFIASQGSQNIQSEICECWASPSSLGAPQAKLPVSVLPCIPELPAKPRRAGQGGLGFPSYPWLCLADVVGHQAHNSFSFVVSLSNDSM